MFPDFHILNRWKNYISQLLNVRKLIYVSQTEIHSAKSLIPERIIEFENSIASMKQYKSSGSDQIQAELS